MSTAKVIEDRPWTVEEFERWNEAREDEVEWIDGVPCKVRYELVDGFPLRMMSGASKAHDGVVRNILRKLADELDDGPCNPNTDDIAVRTASDKLRYPDLSVECDREDDQPYTATNARMVIEVLSSTTRAFDFQRKVVEYQRMETLDYILLVDPTRLDVRLWHRGADRTWEYTEFTSVDETVELLTIGARLPVAAIYRRIEFPPPEGRSLPSA